jgi:hypothetical protein
MITAAKCLGLMFLFVILAQYDEGWVILNTALQAKASKELPKIVKNMFECLLRFDAWLNCPTFWRLDDPPQQKLDTKRPLLNKWKCAN